MASGRSRRAGLTILGIGALLAGATALVWLSQAGRENSESGVVEPTPTIVPSDSQLRSGSLATPVPGDFGTVLVDLAGGRWLTWLGDALPSGVPRGEIVALSPDGKEVIVNEGQRLLAAGLDGKEVRELASGQALWAGFSSDGRVLAIMETLPPRRLTLLMWSDGNRIDVDVDADSAKWVSNTLAVQTRQGAYFVSPDGSLRLIRCDAVFWPATGGTQSLLAFWGTGFACEGSGPNGIYVIEPAGEARFVTQVPAAASVHSISLSSDGSLLALAIILPPDSPAQQFVFDSMEIRVIEVATGRTRFSVARSGFHVMSWSPTENVLLFDRDSCRPPEWQLTLVDAEGNGMRPLAAPSLGVRPMFQAWSPDGRSVAAITDGGVILIDVKTGMTQSVPLAVNPPLLGVSWLVPGWLSITAGGGTDFCP